MQAIVQHDYTSENEDELSIKKGSFITILNPDHTGGWYSASTGEDSGLISKNYVQLLPCSWYKGKVPRSVVNKHLLSQPEDGAFIVHDSKQYPGDFEISAKSWDKVVSYRILEDTAGKYFLWVIKFHTINQLVDFHRRSSILRDDDDKLCFKGMKFRSNSPPPPNPQLMGILFQHPQALVRFSA